MKNSSRKLNDGGLRSGGRERVEPEIEEYRIEAPFAKTNDVRDSIQQAIRRNEVLKKFIERAIKRAAS
jgi:hypothetical protein